MKLVHVKKPELLDLMTITLIKRFSCPEIGQRSVKHPKFVATASYVVVENVAVKLIPMEVTYTGLHCNCCQS